MKLRLIAKNVTRNEADHFEAQIAGTNRITTSGNTKTFTIHYWGDRINASEYEELASITKNFATGLYNIRLLCE